MSLVREVAHNTLWQAGGKIIGTLLGFAATIFLLRYLKDDGYGQYTTVMAYLQLFATIADLGLYIILMKKIASLADPRQVVSNTFTFRLISGIAFLILAILISWLVPQYSLLIKWGILIVSLNFLFITLSQLLTAIFQRFRAMHYVALGEVLSKVFLFFSTLSIIFLFKFGLLAIFWTVALTGLINFLVLFYRAKKFVHFALAFDWSVWQEIFKESWPIALSIALNLIYFKADTFLLTIFRPAEEVGLYGAPYKILEVIITLPAMFVGLILPSLAKDFTEKNWEKFKKVFQRAFDVLVMAAAPLIAGTMILAQPIMILVAGKEFTENPAVLGNILRILIWAVGIIFLGTFSGYMVVTVGKQKPMMFGYLFVALTSLVLYLTLIPRYSYYAAAAVTVYSELLIILFGFYFIWQKTKFFPRLQNFFKTILASILMTALLWLLRGLNIFFLLFLGASFYFFLVYLLRVITPWEIREILKLKKE